MARKIPFSVPFTSEFRVWGVFCHENDYRLSWLINHYLQLDLVRVSDYPLSKTSDSKPSGLSVFSYTEPVLKGNFFLMSNKNSLGQPLFKKPANMDFLLLIKADSNRFSYDEIIKRFKKIPQLMAIYHLDQFQDTKMQNFLYDFELFVSEKLELSI